jgi:Fe-S-cluster containining protein
MSPMILDIFTRLSTLYQSMDKAWNHIASQYNFLCDGCEDNCCRSLFFHHTIVEKAYLLHGFDQLSQDIKENSIARANAYCNKTFVETSSLTSLKLMCPLNNDGRCILYRYRPMICRLHGLPHELHKPGQAPLKGPGCHAGLFDSKGYLPFDRTPFYREMAGIEMEFRKETQNKTRKIGKIKETVAQMLIG